MITAAKALSSIPAGLRDPLITEFHTIAQNFLEQRWLPSELSGGRFSEFVYTILDGHAKKSYATAPSKPGNFVEACRKLESNTHASRSFQILIPRMLPAFIEPNDTNYVMKIIRDLHARRFVEFAETTDKVRILPPGAKFVQELIRKKNLSNIA
jgi:hypothetical protein